jgi:hypothetical protein
MLVSYPDDRTRNSTRMPAGQQDQVGLTKSIQLCLQNVLCYLSKAFENNLIRWMQYLEQHPWSSFFWEHRS